MKKKEKTVLAAMTPEELGKIVLDAQTALRHQGLSTYSKQIKNVREGRVLRKKIAIAKTTIRQKELTHGK